MALIDTMRAIQYSRQLGHRRAMPSAAEQAVAYAGRDPITGYRQVVAADGSILHSSWRREVEPPTYPVAYKPPTLTTPGSLND